MKAKGESGLGRWKPEGLHLQSAWIGYGVLAYHAFAVNGDLPVGTTWVRLTSNSRHQAVCEIIDIYVPEKWRRMGIGTYMMKTLLDMYGILLTGTGTKQGGMALMKSMGWKQNKHTTQWYLFGKPKLIEK